MRQQTSYGAPASGPETEARVKWFNPDKGFGFVEMTDGSGEAFLHIRQVEAAGHTALESGTTLVIRVGAGQKGPQVQEIVSVDTSTAEPEPPRGARPARPMRQGQGGPGQSGGFGRPTGGQSARPVSGPPEVPATVKWFDSVKGYGFVSVEGESKDLFLHISVVERAGLGQLEQGQAVRVAIVEGRKGPEVGAIELA
ncbi:cold-shock protein [Microvirga sp. CF3016]|uniref:cold-shock protein n=1 Tax=Microvirga sp. CF3016 TaxID=3110181 RepID=UPI002E77D6FA|nr:cold shock domain-containing protein [Microvirga sp. CF3016]MEE1611498.1 cold shock domain-containing protein [Microvirga sp. CF3016]